MSSFAKADTIPEWKVFYNSRLLKEMKFGNKSEEIKIDTLTYKSGDFLDIVYNDLKTNKNFIYDIEVNSESAVDLNIKYNGEKSLLRTENSVELFMSRINDKSKPIRIDLRWVIDWLKEYPHYRIEVKLVERNHEENKYKDSVLFYIVNK